MKIILPLLALLLSTTAYAKRGRYDYDLKEGTYKLYYSLGSAVMTSTLNSFEISNGCVQFNSFEDGKYLLHKVCGNWFIVEVTP